MHSLGWTCALLLTAVFANSCSRDERAVRTAEPGEPIAALAAQEVDRFHASLKAGRYQDICRTADAAAFRGVSGLPCSEFLAYLHQKLGDPVLARRLQLPLVEANPSSAGVRIGLDYETRYDRGTAREHFEWRINGGKADLISYKVDADELSR